MWPWSKMNDEELETAAGGMHAGLEEISDPGSVIPKPITDKLPLIPITGDPGKGETAQFVPI